MIAAVLPKSGGLWLPEKAKRGIGFVKDKVLNAGR
jgi:hypothetical protein